MLGGRLLAVTEAAFIAAQVGNAGNGIASLKQQGVQTGDYALWLNASPTPTDGWTLLTGGPTQIYGKALTLSDLTMAAAPSQAWGLAIYRDVTSAAVRSASGFAKAPGHMGAVGVFYAQSGSYPSQIASPPGAAPRLYGVNGPYYALFDVVAAADAYPDGAPFGNGSSGYWGVIELLRS